MRDVTYNEALSAVKNGKKIIMLPKGANPLYLAFRKGDHNPMAIPLEWQGSYFETKLEASTIKDGLLSAFWGEPGISRSKITYWLMED